MQFFERLAQLERTRTPFAIATVVARRSPVSSHLGDRAIVLADGHMEGFVGGSCSRDLVRRYALAALRSGKPRLLQIRPDQAPEEAAPADAERISVPMACASNGAVDVYIEPHVPARVLIVVGFTPVADALARMTAAANDFEVVRVVADEELRDVPPSDARVVALDELRALRAELDDIAWERAAVVVASQGHYDERALELLLAAEPPGFIGLLASRNRADAVRGVLVQAGVDPQRCARIRNPVGIDIGARSAPEVAVSILAEIVANAPVVAERALELATDPVCGMEVEVARARRTEHGGKRFYFCGAGCQSAFTADPGRYLGASQHP
jgi:xanthine dehydrogenase accessory factor